MSTIRTAILSASLTLVLAVAAYLAFAPMTAQAASAGCGPATAQVYTTQQLQNMLNGRYLHRVALPR